MDFLEVLEDKILKNERLDIYEKMCLIVLMSQGEEVRLTSEELASYMGCGLNTAKRAFDSLRIKGFLSKDYAEEAPTKRTSNIVSADESDVLELTQEADFSKEAFQEGFFTDKTGENFVKESQKPSFSDDEKMRRAQMAEYILGGDAASPQKEFVSRKEVKNALVDQLIALIDEKISFKEANIILAFANNDLDKVRRHYLSAKQSQVSDTIGVLISSLQKKETQVIKADETVSENRQIDTNRILKMQAYKNSRFEK